MTLLAPADPETDTDNSTEVSGEQTPGSEIATRREMRAALSAHQTPAPPARPLTAPMAIVSMDAPKAPTRKKRTRRSIINLLVVTVAAGIVATMTIPAYAFNPSAATASTFGASANDVLKHTQAQSVNVPTTAQDAAVVRDAATATTPAQLAASQAAAAAAAKAQTERAQAAVTLQHYATSYTGPSASDYLANPPYPNFSLSQVFSVASQYQGVPYIFGGSTPAGFDCSGFVMFVYAQFGISLPHSVSGEAARGTRISIQDAQPGDVIIFDNIGHDGIYAGNGNILDAPKPGGHVSIRPIWTSDFYVVRLGI